MVGTACSMGTTGNGFIVVINFIEWIKSKKLTTCDAILITLGLSRSFFQWTLLVHAVCILCYSFLYSQNQGKDTVAVLCLTKLYQCLVCHLTVFYSVKILSLSQPTFLPQLKPRLLGLVLWLPLGSVLLCLIACIPFTHRKAPSHEQLVTVSHSPAVISDNPITTQIFFFPLENLSELVIWRIDRENWISGFGIGFTPSFFMFVISAVLLIPSLWRYNRLMQEVSSSYRNASAEAWIVVIKALFSFILYAFNVIALFLLLSNISSLEAPSSVPVQLDCHLCLYTKHDLDSGVETAGRCVCGELEDKLRQQQGPCPATQIQNVSILQSMEVHYRRFHPARGVWAMRENGEKGN
ncbi:taste receptor type 2 member 40-like [Chelonoidis abingdonii]|uniref:taste receptor type 2 member 40-like n=1 Tax=Chelonoidis abingdonii TaxID=106734 RepID=UPI003F496195